MIGKTPAVAGALLLGIVAVSLPAIDQQQLDTFSSYVDNTGTIDIPTNYRIEWAFLGSWVVASGEGDSRVPAGLHNVYTQPEAITAYKKLGRFPDGTVLIKELLTTDTAPMTTGTMSWGDEVEGWFVMIKDSEGRYPDHQLWGDGWGWALFNADKQLVTKNYKAECAGCHSPAQASDWVYVKGYLPLR